MRTASPITLKRRAEFLHAAARGKKVARPGFVLQLVATSPDAPVRVGYTASRKVGNAVIRNRARRRLREAVRAALGQPELNGINPRGADLVVIARHDTATIEFCLLRDGLAQAFTQALAGMLRR